MLSYDREPTDSRMKRNPKVKENVCNNKVNLKKGRI